MPLELNVAPRPSQSSPFIPEPRGLEMVTLAQGTDCIYSSGLGGVQYTHTLGGQIPHLRMQNWSLDPKALALHVQIGCSPTFGARSAEHILG